MGPLALDLSNNGFVACVGMVSRAEIANALRRGRGSSSRRSELTADRRCLFCRSEHPVGGEEHVLSVALGNHFWVLPPNVVCASCNNGPLSRLDTALQEHPFIAMLRVLSSIPGRSGQPPTVGASNLRMARSDDGRLVIETDSFRHARDDGGDVQVRPSRQHFGPRHYDRTGRALLKTGLGLLRLVGGEGASNHTKYDHVRDSVLGDTTVPLRHAFGNSQLPTTALQIMLVAHNELAGVIVSLDYFGVRMCVETDGDAGTVSDEFLAREHVSVGADFPASPTE